MNAVEIEAAVSELASAPYDATEFPFQFLAAFDRKETTLKRLRKGDTNKSDIPSAYLLTGAIHIATCPVGQTRETLDQLRASLKTTSARAKFIFVTDGAYFEAEDVTAAPEHIADLLPNLANHFGFFLPLAGISTVKEIKDSAIDVRATGRLNKLYVELLRINPEWSTAARRHDMNHFMARLIFCFFAEHTDIFHGSRLFTDSVEMMTEADGVNTHQVLEQIFRTMNVKIADRKAEVEANTMPAYADKFPYVNGGLFADSAETPVFNRIARSYLLQAGKLEWQHINPDIFGSMIQAVADDEERGALGMHYTSVPNILKVLNPLFLHDLRAQLEVAGNNGRMLLNLRQRMSRIRVFDPACGSGNFLVIAYKQMRSIEAAINKLRGEEMRPTDISEKNFRGIELRDFAAEIARLALVIAKYQCDVQHRGPLAAKAEFLPLKDDNWITCGNALRLDWLKICPQEGTNVKLHSDDLFQTPLEQPEIDFENEGGEIYVCGNPPYKGGTEQNNAQKADLEYLLASSTPSWKSLDYVSGWFVKFSHYSDITGATCAFVSTSSITQGEQVARLWPLVLLDKRSIRFAYTPFKWSNLAAQNAGVTVAIIGVGPKTVKDAKLFEVVAPNEVKMREVPNINAYLVAYQDLIVRPQSKIRSGQWSMTYGNKPADGGHLIMNFGEGHSLKGQHSSLGAYIKPFFSYADTIRGRVRYCLWILPSQAQEALKITEVKERTERVAEMRRKSDKGLTVQGAKTPYAFQQVRQTGHEIVIAVPSVSSETREYLPTDLFPKGTILSNAVFGLFDAPLWNMALIASRIHLIWVATVCGKLKTDFRYSNTLGWNTFPTPNLTEQNKNDLTRSAEDILLAREAHFPATIADLYDPENMPENLRAAHNANDEVLERIYIGRRFRNDTERLEKLFEMYTKMTATSAASNKPAAKRGKKATA